MISELPKRDVHRMFMGVDYKYVGEEIKKSVLIFI